MKTLKARVYDSDPRNLRTRDMILGAATAAPIDIGVIYDGMEKGIDALPETARVQLLERLKDRYFSSGEWRGNAAGQQHTGDMRVIDFARQAARRQDMRDKIRAINEAASRFWRELSQSR